MFHQVSFDAKAKDDFLRPGLDDEEKAVYSKLVKQLQSSVTDEFFRTDIGLRGVNLAWLAKMRRQISDRDVWVSGRQLVEDDSGIVDKIVSGTTF